MDIGNGEKQPGIQHEISKKNFHAQPLNADHDVYSLVAAMKCFKIVETNDRRSVRVGLHV